MLQALPDRAPQIATSRLRLRPIGLDDCEAFLAIHSDAETLAYWSGELISTLDEARVLVERELDHAKSGNCLNWGIALPESDTLIGKFALFAFHAQNRRAEVGYILNRAYWGKGLMSEVLETGLEYAFDTLNLHRIEADTDPDNTASLALLEKNGFKREGFFRDRWFIEGEWKDSVMLALLRPDYAQMTE